MIHTHYIIQAEAVLHAGQPPRIARLLVIIPAVQRIAPELSRLRKCIRWTPGNSLRLSIRIELEQFRMCPAVCAVHGNIDRNITNDLDSLFIGIAL